LYVDAFELADSVVVSARAGDRRVVIVGLRLQKIAGGRSNTAE